MEQDEWKKIYECYQKPLFLYALSLTNNIQDAEDLVQETFIKAFLSYQNTGSLKYWLVTVVKHNFLNLCRKRKREMTDDMEERLKFQASQEREMIEKIIEKEERRVLFYAIQELPVIYREILMESVYFQMGDEDIAKLHDITRENVRKIRSRAKQKLIKRLEESS